MKHQLKVLHVASATIKPLIALTIRTNAIIAEIEPDILAAIIRADTIVPAHGRHVYLCPVAVMADSGAPLLEIVVLLANPIIRKLDLIIQKATIVTWVVDGRFEPSNVGIEKAVEDWLAHIEFGIFFVF